MARRPPRLDPPRPRRHRPLSEEEVEIWRRFVGTVAPIDRADAPAPKPEAGPDAAPMRKAASAEPPHRRVKAPRLPDFDPRKGRDIAKGSVDIGARLDLHGLRQDEAHAALVRFLRSAQARDIRYVIVITGRGGGAYADGSERGVLRRVVPLWLAEPGLRDVVVSYATAARGHGGDGALYVHVRKAKDRRPVKE